jgi:hypothetical protein
VTCLLNRFELLAMLHIFMRMLLRPILFVSQISFDICPAVGVVAYYMQGL